MAGALPVRPAGASIPADAEPGDDHDKTEGGQAANAGITSVAPVLALRVRRTARQALRVLAFGVGVVSVSGCATMSPAPGPVGASPVPQDEKAQTERVQRLAREYLDKPYYQAPFACDAYGWASEKNYVVDVAPWAEAAGLRKGDRLLAFGDVSLAEYDSASEAWWKVPRGDNVVVRVERAGAETTIRLPCRDNSQTWQADVSMLRAIVQGQWQECVEAVRTVATASRLSPASLLFVRVVCLGEGAIAKSQRMSDEYWRALHAWATKAIEESRYKPSGLTEVRSTLLAAADALEKDGRASWASDIRQQISAFTLAPTSP